MLCNKYGIKTSNSAYDSNPKIEFFLNKRPYSLEINALIKFSKIPKIICCQDFQFYQPKLHNSSVYSED